MSDPRKHRLDQKKGSKHGSIDSAEELKRKRELLWRRIAKYQPLNKEGLIDSIADHLEFYCFQDQRSVNDHDIYLSLAASVRDRMIEFANDTQETYRRSKCKQAYYLSLEYLMGKSLKNNMINLGIDGVSEAALHEIGYDIKDIAELEVDAGLGNGGLGRLAACYLDSLATLKLPATGYGIRYTFGTFQQKIVDGEQREYPDNWLEDGSIWVISRPKVNYKVNLGGQVQAYEKNGRTMYRLINQKWVNAVACDMLIPGYKSMTVNTLRLWKSTASNDFDFRKFNEGAYFEAVEAKVRSETISKVLYPSDKDLKGKYLRLTQQYFFVSASIQDIVNSFEKNHGSDYSLLPDKVAIQLNDTHPIVGIPELMRILMDEKEMNWEASWDISQKVFAYTNHTILPEALEKWPVFMFETLLPRHLMIIYEINSRFLKEVRSIVPNDEGFVQSVSIIEESEPKQIRMSHLGIIGSKAINGVAELHSDLLKTHIFANFYRIYPDRFLNVTNGITPRRWLLTANPRLSHLISSKIGSSWPGDLKQLSRLAPYAEDEIFQTEWLKVKLENKSEVVDWIKTHTGVEVNKNSLFDIQVKRIHEYKRQLLNILYCVSRYFKIKANPHGDFVPRTVIFGGKAAPSYDFAKLIIRLINDVANVVNNDPDIGDKLKIVFVENFGVGLGEKIYPSADISEQISTAGLEASGTGNMKFCLNGAVIVGTMDGANIEILEEVGDENIFIFGLTTPEVQDLKNNGYDPKHFYFNDDELKHCMNMIVEGFFSPNQHNRYQWIFDSLFHQDKFMVLADFRSYVDAQERVDKAFVNKKKWLKKSILNVAGIAKFSSDRSIMEYARDIWGISPVNTIRNESKINLLDGVDVSSFIDAYNKQPKQKIVKK